MSVCFSQQTASSESGFANYRGLAASTGKFASGGTVVIPSAVVVARTAPRGADLGHPDLNRHGKPI